jgi:hypothetical protein
MQALLPAKGEIMETQLLNKQRREIVGIAAAAAVLLCFFLPWVEVGFSFLNTNLTGYQIATGNGPIGLSIKSWPSLLLIPVSMATIMVLLLASRFGYLADTQIKDERLISVIIIAGGGLSAGVMIYQYLDLNSEFSNKLVSMLAQNLVNHMFAWIASLLGSFVVLADGLVGLHLSSGKPRSMAAGSYRMPN